jgi:hypothetical protein
MSYHGTFVMVTEVLCGSGTKVVVVVGLLTFQLGRSDANLE